MVVESEGFVSERAENDLATLVQEGGRGEEKGGDGGVEQAPAGTDEGAREAKVNIGARKM